MQLVNRNRISCPICSFNRLIDADNADMYEVIPKEEVKLGEGYLYQKCPRCGRQIALKEKCRKIG